MEVLEMKSLSRQWELKEQQPQFVTFPVAVPGPGLIPGAVPAFDTLLTVPWEGHQHQGNPNSWSSEGAQEQEF